MAARKGRGNTAVVYNTYTLTTYCNSAELAMALDRLETTHFGSTAAESIAGDASYTISLQGDWDTVLDGYLAVDAINIGNKRNASIAFTGSAQTVTYSWTGNNATGVGAEIQDYNISSGASDKITFSATLVLSGAPSRSAA